MDKVAELEKVVGLIRKKYGEGAIFKLGEMPDIGVDAISTGSLLIDKAVGIGGLPRGRVVEVYGPESSGKTTLCQHVIAEAQRLGESCAFVDMEHALDPQYAEKCGVNVSDLYVSQPTTGEEALEIVQALVDSGSVGVIVVDSVAALVPRAEIEGEMGDAHVGLQARLMSQAMRKLSGALKKSNTLLIFTNQLRMKIGVMFGNPETTSGGNALKFYASVRLDLRARVEKAAGDPVATVVRVKVKKNKVAPPFGEAEVYLKFDRGFVKAYELLTLGVERGLITKSKAGGWFQLTETVKEQGQDKAMQYLDEHPELSRELEAKLRETLYVKKN